MPSIVNQVAPSLVPTVTFTVNIQDVNGVGLGGYCLNLKNGASFDVGQTITAGTPIPEGGLTLHVIKSQDKGWAQISGQKTGNDSSADPVFPGVWMTSVADLNQDRAVIFGFDRPKLAKPRGRDKNSTRRKKKATGKR